MLHAVIMAGGTGSRFWPRSTKACPKQFLNIFGDQTMLQETADRISSLVPPERLWIITNDRYIDLVQQQLPDVPDSNIIGEPVAKNTAPCVASAAALLSKQDPEATMLVLPADHQVTDREAFLSIVKSGVEKAREDETLVTIGIKPDRPETGYGYIEFDKQSEEIINDNQVKEVVRFREKPNLKEARQYIYSGNFLWNSGMFIWTTTTVINQFEQYLPEIHTQIEKLQPAVESGNQKEAIDAFYRACPSISIDYGIMEKAETVYVVPGEFGWNDVGSWRAVYELKGKDANGNVVQAENMQVVEANNNLVHSTNGKMIALVGVENLAVVETEKAILVCDLDNAQGVKQIVNSLKEKKETEDFL